MGTLSLRRSVAEDVNGGRLGTAFRRVDLGDTARHVVQFYDQAPFLMGAVSRFLGTSLGTGGAAVAIVSQSHRDQLTQALTARGLDVNRLIDDGRYLVLDAADTLSTFMVDGSPDPSRFAEVIGDAIARVAPATTNREVRAFGEMVTLLWADGRRDAAIRLEELWNALAQDLRFSLLCAYPLHLFAREADAAPFLRICGEHAVVIPAENFTALTHKPERLRAVSRLQQKALTAETETAQRKKTEKSLERQQQELHDFLENAVEGLHRVGHDQRILWANKSLLGLLGYTAEEYIGHPLVDFYVNAESFEEFWQRIMHRDTVYDFSAQLRCKDGSTKQVLIHSNGLWEDGRFLYTRCFIRDVTEQHRLRDELNGKLQQLADMDRRKNEFLAMLGHELRNPLAAVRNAIAVLCLEPAQRERALDIARRQTDQLGRLVDDLLDVARITQGSLRLRTERVCFAQIVKRAIETTRQLFEDANRDLAVSLDAADVQVEADPTRLEQVIVNLISNAIKYTQPGSRIEIALERQGQEVALLVRDDGIGIAPEILPHVFDLFVQADGTLDRARGGLGVGLTVARRLVEMQGGRIEGHSDGLGKGAEFVVRMAILPSATVDAAGTPGGAPASSHQRILLVEDNADAAESLKMFLELLGNQVQVAADGVAAIEALRADVPDLMLVDIGLPGMDGYELARRVRRDDTVKHVLLVALTGYGGEQDKRRALAAGFDYHLVKPVSPDTLREVVGRLGRRNQFASDHLEGRA